MVRAAIHRTFGSELRLPYGKLTPPFQWPASSTCQTVYIVLTTSHSPVFLVNSRLALFTVTGFGCPDLTNGKAGEAEFTDPGAPYPEVTGPFCLVP